MPHPSHSPSFDDLIGQVVVFDLSSPYVCIGLLLAADERFYLVADADLHDFRDSPATRENYVFDSARVGIRRNRKQVRLRREEVVAITRFADISET